MEGWQKEHLMENWVRLIRNTNCTAFLTAGLRQERVLFQDEVEMLDRKDLNSFEKSTKLYELLITRTGSYDILIHWLRKLHQSGAYEILECTEKIFRSYGSISIEKGHILGTGCFGTVVMKGKFDGRVVAVKVLNSDVISTATAAQEVSFLKKLDHHENILRYHHSERNKNYIYIALELCKSSLQDEIDFKSLTLDPAVVLEECTKGLAYLHECNVIHRDLKPANVLLTDKGRVKIADFGLSKQIPIDKTYVRTIVAGTVDWLAPEVLEYTTTPSGREIIKMSKPSDIFSLGCIYYFVLTYGSHPFGQRLVRQFNICNDKPEFGESVITDDWLKLVKKMVSYVPKERPTAENILLTQVFKLKPISRSERTPDVRMPEANHNNGISVKVRPNDLDIMPGKIAKFNCEVSNPYTAIWFYEGVQIISEIGKRWIYSTDDHLVHLLYIYNVSIWDAGNYHLLLSDNKGYQTKLHFKLVVSSARPRRLEPPSFIALPKMIKVSNDSNVVAIPIQISGFPEPHLKIFQNNIESSKLSHVVIEEKGNGKWLVHISQNAADNTDEGEYVACAKNEIDTVNSSFKIVSLKKAVPTNVDRRLNVDINRTVSTIPVTPMVTPAEGNVQNVSNETVRLMHHNLTRTKEDEVILRSPAYSTKILSRNSRQEHAYGIRSSPVMLPSSSKDDALESNENVERKCTASEQLDENENVIPNQSLSTSPTKDSNSFDRTVNLQEKAKETNGIVNNFKEMEPTKRTKGNAEIFMSLQNIPASSSQDENHSFLPNSSKSTSARVSDNVSSASKRSLTRSQRVYPLTRYQPSGKQEDKLLNVEPLDDETASLQMNHTVPLINNENMPHTKYQPSKNTGVEKNVSESNLIKHVSSPKKDSNFSERNPDPMYQSEFQPKARSSISDHNDYAASKRRHQETNQTKSPHLKKPSYPIQAVYNSLGYTSNNSSNTQQQHQKRTHPLSNGKLDENVADISTRNQDAKSTDLRISASEVHASRRRLYQSRELERDNKKDHVTVAPPLPTTPPPKSYSPESYPTVSQPFISSAFITVNQNDTVATYNSQVTKRSPEKLATTDDNDFDKLKMKPLENLDDSPGYDTETSNNSVTSPCVSPTPSNVPEKNGSTQQTSQYSKRPKDFPDNFQTIRDNFEAKSPKLSNATFLYRSPSTQSLPIKQNLVQTIKEKFENLTQASKKNTLHRSPSTKSLPVKSKKWYETYKFEILSHQGLNIPNNLNNAKSKLFKFFFTGVKR